MRWWWRRWRAAHYLWLAQENYRQRPSRRNSAARDRAQDHLDQIEANRP